MGLLALTSVSCNQPQTTELSSLLSSSNSSTGQAFASGTKAVKIVTSTNSTTGSFTLPGVLPAVSPIPILYPGYDGTSTYLPGVSAARYFDVDGATVISKPSWLIDVQLGVTTVTTAASCAKFGNAGASGKDVADYYRVSETDCAGTPTGANDGTGSGTDKVFARIVLSRDATVLGTADSRGLASFSQACWGGRSAKV